MTNTISSESSSTDSIDNLEHIENSLEYLKANYTESSLDEFQDLQLKLNQSIAKINLKNQKLVRENFSKFVKCRETVSQIQESNNEEYFENILNQIDYHVMKISDKITEFYSVNPRIYNNNDRISSKITQFYDPIINLHQKLENCMKYKDFKGFIKHYKKAQKLMNDSAYLQEKMKNCDSLVIHFQNILLTECEKSLNDESVYFFELLKSFNENKSQKIENTLLILLKNFLNERENLRNVNNCLSYAIESFQLVKNEFIEQQMLITILNWCKKIALCDIFYHNDESDMNQYSSLTQSTSQTSLDLVISDSIEEKIIDFYKIKLIKQMFKKFIVFSKILSQIITKSNYSFFQSKFNIIKNEITVSILSQISQCIEDENTFYRLIRSLSSWIPIQKIKDEIYQIIDEYTKIDDLNTLNQSNINYKSINGNLNSKQHNSTDKFDFLLSYTERIGNLNHKLIKCNKILNNNLNFKRIRKIQLENQNLILTQFLKSLKCETPEEILMIILGLKNTFTFDKEQIKKVELDILKDKIVRYFLCKIFDLEEPKLSKNEEQKVKSIDKQFNSLRL